MSTFLKRFAKDEEAFYVVEYVLMVAIVVVFLVGTIEFTVIGNPNDLMGTAIGGGDSQTGVRSADMKTVSGALSPLYRFIVTVLGLPVA
jgi:Flp pilus assembly pilin Flp